MQTFTEIVFHETVHYARKNLRRNSSSILGLSLDRAMEEGIAEFVSEYMKVGKQQFREGMVLRSNDDQYLSIHQSKLLYSIIMSDLKSKSIKPKSLSNYLMQQTPYSSGSAITTILLVANNLDIDATVKEMLSSENIKLAKKVIDTVCNDNNFEFYTKLAALDILRETFLIEANMKFEQNASKILNNPLSFNVVRRK